MPGSSQIGVELVGTQVGLMVFHMMDHVNPELRKILIFFQLFRWMLIGLEVVL